MYEILKPFNYSPDGVTVVRYQAGETQPVSADLAPGLIAEGFIKDPNAKASDAKPKKK
jgi:hypothetical protein